MTTRRKNAGVEIVEKAKKRNFGTTPKMDPRLVSHGGERAAFLRQLLLTHGSMTKRELSDAWVTSREVIDRVEANKLLDSVIRWVDKRVKQGELEKKGSNGDDFGSVLYGLTEAPKP